MWGLPVNAHRYFAESLGGIHAFTMLIVRYVSFVHSLAKSQKRAVLYLFEKVKNNVDTVTGRNIAFILEKTGYSKIEDINTCEVKRNLKFVDTANEGVKWKVDMIKEIVDVKQNVLLIDFEDGDKFDTENLNDFLYYISTS